MLSIFIWKLWENARIRCFLGVFSLLLLCLAFCFFGYLYSLKKKDTKGKGTIYSLCKISK